MSTVEACLMNLANSVVHQQYARKADLKDIWDRLVSSLPSAFVQPQSFILGLHCTVLSIFVYYSETWNPPSPDFSLNR